MRLLNEMTADERQSHDLDKRICRACWRSQRKMLDRRVSTVIWNSAEPTHFPPRRFVRHDAVPRGPLKPALELFELSPDSPPATADARLLWDMGQAVHAYVGRLFEAGVLCPFDVGAKDPKPQRSE